MSACSACGQPERGADALLPLDVAGDVGPALEADPLGLHRRPDVDEGVAHDEHVRTGDLVGDPLLLRAGHEVVEQDARPCGPGRDRSRQHVDEVVGAVEAARRRRPRRAGRRPRPSRRARRRGLPSTKIRLARATRAARAVDGHRTGRGAGRAAAARPALGCDEDDRLALEQEARARAGTYGAAAGGPPGSGCRRSRSTATISPTQSVVTSSTTAPSSAGASTARPRLGTRQSPARTSEP